MSNFMLERKLILSSNALREQWFCIFRGNMRQRVHPTFWARILISEWTIREYLAENIGIWLTRISRMKASVKLSICNKSYLLGLGLGLESNRSYLTDKSLKHLYMFAIAGATEEVAFSPPLWPRRAFFWIAVALFRSWHISVFLCLKDAYTFIKRPAGTMILHCQRHNATTFSPHFGGTSLDFWVTYLRILERKYWHSIDQNQSNESQR